MEYIKQLFLRPLLTLSLKVLITPTPSNRTKQRERWLFILSLCFLLRFSQFFVSPLVKAEAMEREVQAVDSGVQYYNFVNLINRHILPTEMLLFDSWDTEFNQVLQNDSCRLQQLQCHTSTPGHPFNRFFWGKFTTSKPSLFFFSLWM